MISSRNKQTKKSNSYKRTKNTKIEAKFRIIFIYCFDSYLAENQEAIEEMKIINKKKSVQSESQTV